MDYYEAKLPSPLETISPEQLCHEQRGCLRLAWINREPCVSLRVHMLSSASN